jgi:PAS domain S-box-containing protein
MLSSYNQQGEFSWVNDTWVKELGWSLEDMKSVNMLEEFYPDPTERRTAVEFMVNPEGRWKDFNTRCKNGTFLNTQWMNIPLHDGSYIGIGKNINETKIHTAELLRKNLELSSYETALNKYAIVAKTDPTGKIKYVNDKFCEIAKYSQEELIGKDHRILNSGSHSKEFFSNMWKEINQGRPWRGEIKNKAKDGTFYWVDTTIAPIFDGEKISEFIAIRYDITDDIQVEMVTRAILNLRASYISAGQDTNRILKIILNAVITLTESNYGLVFCPGDKTGSDQWVQVDLDEQKLQFNFRSIVNQVMDEYRNLEFKHHDLNMHAIPIFNNLHLNGIIILGNKQHRISKSMLSAMNSLITVIGEIIAHHKLSLESLENQSMLEMLAHASEVGLWDWDLETNDVNFSQRWCEMLGYKKQEVLPSAIFWQENLHPDDADLAVKVCRDYLDEKTSVYEVKFRMKHKNGHWVPILTKGKIIKWDINGKPIRFAGTHFDLTHLAAMEEKLEHQRKLSQHQAKLASIGQLAAGVGHEINNPLAIIKGYLMKIEDDLKGENVENKEIFYMLNKINIASDRIVHIVKGLRTFSRSDTDQLSSFEFTEALEESLMLLKDIYQKEGIDIQYLKKTKQKLYVYGNRGRLQQVMVNLFANAKDATEGQQDRYIKLELSEQNNLVSITLSDNGRGIDASIKDKIFDPFFTTKDVNKGTGIGLSLVSSIIKEHEGSIHVDSQSSCGATFTVTLPLDQTKVKALEIMPEPAIPEPMLQQNLSVLLADDEEDIRTILAIMLRGMGMEVAIAENGKKALDMYQEHEFDLILTDLKMPLMDGKTLIHAIQSNKKVKKPKCILMTGGVDASLDELQIGTEIHAVLPKPFDEHILKKKLQEVFPEFFQTSKQEGSY